MKVKALIGACTLALTLSAAHAAPDNVVIWAPGDNGPVKDWSKDPILQAVEKATNTDIQIVKIGWDVYTQRVNAALASRQTPDIIATLSDTPTVIRLAREGALASFTGAVAKAAPNVLALYTDEPNLNQLKVNGKVYAEPVFWNTGDDVGGTKIHIRKDLLDKLGLKVPGTFAQYFDFLDKCAKANNIAGVTFNGKNFGLDQLAVFAGAEGLNVYGWAKTPSGYASPLVQPGMKNALLLFRQMVARKLVDPAAWENDQDATRARYVSGGACSMLFNGGGHVGRIQNDFDLAGKGYQEWVLPAPSAGQTVAGKPARGYPLSPSFYGLTVLPNLKGNNPVAAARVLNYLVSDAGVKLTVLGVKGVDYSENGNDIKLLPARAGRGFPATAGDTGAHPLATPIVSWVPQNWQDFQLLYGKPGAFKAWYDQMWVNQRKYTIPSVGALIQTDASIKYGPALSDLVSRSLVEIVRAGSDAKASAKFAQFVQNWKSAGGDAVTGDFNQAMNAQSK